MKFLFKYKTLFATLVILLFSLGRINAFPEENKFSDPFARASANSGASRVAPPPNPTDGSAHDEEAPVGDAIPLLLGLGLVYGMYVFKNRKVRPAAGSMKNTNDY
jgi:hypothetical protein